jgi:hypothetical protein
MGLGIGTETHPRVYERQVPTKMQVSNSTHGYPIDTGNLKIQMNICNLWHMHTMSTGSFNMYFVACMLHAKL